MLARVRSASASDPHSVLSHVKYVVGQSVESCCGSRCNERALDVGGDELFTCASYLFRLRAKQSDSQSH